MKTKKGFDITDVAYGDAIRVLNSCVTSNGFYASPGYDMVFGRDSMIISLGAQFLSEFQKTIKSSILTLSKYQSKKGQIPNAVDKFEDREHHIDFASIDSSLWFIIASHSYCEKFSDKKTLKKINKNLDRAIEWLSYQDVSENGMLVQQPTTDWFDAFPHRYGHTINTHALYYKALKLMGKDKEAENIKEIVNKNSDNGLWDKENGYYFSWRWKNHGRYKEHSNFFDSLGNLLAIIFELADKKQSKKILNYIEKNNVAKPYPIKSIYPPIKKGNSEWHDYFLDCDAKKPYHYSNGGIWTFIGGFYVLALIKVKQFKKAKEELEKLAKANVLTNFTEWLNGKTGKTGNAQSGLNGNQGWNASMYILAYESFRRKRVLI